MLPPRAIRVDLTNDCLVELLIRLFNSEMRTTTTNLDLNYPILVQLCTEYTTRYTRFGMTASVGLIDSQAGILEFYPKPKPTISDHFVNSVPYQGINKLRYYHGNKAPGLSAPQWRSDLALFLLLSPGHPNPTHVTPISKIYINQPLIPSIFYLSMVHFIHSVILSAVPISTTKATLLSITNIVEIATAAV